ncbi:MAG TPA: hypothetical protein VN428_16245 [Bryobacteraceae bacterium]|nr:hypothetical protein [Bryobacteraceae bacterium]
MEGWTTIPIAAMALALLPMLLFGFAGEWVSRRIERWPTAWRIALPAVLCIPYVIVTVSARSFRWEWFAVYALLPVVVAGLLHVARVRDAREVGTALDYLVVFGLALIVDLRWFAGTWPRHLSAINKAVLLDAGLYGFQVIRGLSGIGYDLRVRTTDLRTGLRELALYALIAIPLGLALGFLKLKLHWQKPGMAVFAWVVTFFFVAVPEEAVGCRTCSSAAWDARPRCSSRRSSSASRISISGPYSSTGAMC